MRGGITPKTLYENAPVFRYSNKPYQLTVISLHFRNNKDDDVDENNKIVKNCSKSYLFCFPVAFVVYFVYRAPKLNDISISIVICFECSAAEYDEISNTAWTYDCIELQCIRRKANSTYITTLETCNMLCSEPSLWPKPKNIFINRKNASTFDKNLILAKINAHTLIRRDLKQAFRIFLGNLPTSEYTAHGNEDVVSFKINITVDSQERRLELSTNESYSLSVQLTPNNSILANITAPTYFGARNALETLSQLIWWDTSVKKLKVYHGVRIDDSPVFAHRGVMVDTARNFFAIKSLMKVVDGMAASKLNVLHLHLTDSVSFPIELPNNPELSKFGAYGPQKIYTSEDIKGLIEYARIRGIRTILEIDAPSHVNEGWNHFNNDEENLIICGEENVFNGHLNPDNKNTFILLKSIYEDMLQLGTDSETFHIGGDEVDLICLGQTNASKAFVDPYEFWANFTNNILDTVVAANRNNKPKNLVLWSSPLTDYYLHLLNHSDNLVVQYWYGQLQPIVRHGNKIIFSTVGHWYLDCGFGPWKPSQTDGVCDPYTPWQTFYKYRPWEEESISKNQVLGGEACLWTEQVDESTLETRLWPRGAAFAERLWSDPDNFDSYDVYTRISTHIDRLSGRGFQVAAIWPLWCTQNPGKC
ncbi:hypothetical protein JTB14_016811 [Gonioctena quinquepunctata]|nr:hypothetical protein JTB14_016811 [Gonioctena quinquepunctata]